MGAIAFSLNDDVRQQFTEFASGSVTVLELHLTPEESVGLSSSHSIDPSSESLASLVSAAEPRFFMVRFPKSPDQMAAEAGGLMKPQAVIFFVYSCPENAPLKLKMTYSTAKVRGTPVDDH